MSKFVRILTASLWRDLQRGLVIVFFVALFARLTAVAWLGMSDLVEGSESGVIAANLVVGRGYTFDFYGSRPDTPLRSYKPPLYALLLAACMRWKPGARVLLGTIQAFLGSLTAVFIYVVGERVASRQVGGMAGLATALYPPLIVQTARPFSMTLDGFLLSCLVVLTLRLLRTPGLLGASVVGGAIGLLVLSRTSMLGLTAVVVAWLWLNRHRMPSWARLSAVVVVAVALTVLPWVVRNYMIHGRPLLSTNGGHTFWNGNNPFTTGSSLDVYIDKVNRYAGLNIDLTPGTNGIIELRPYPLPSEVLPRVTRLSETELDVALYAAGLAFIRENPRDWLRLLLTKVTSFWWFRPNLGRSSPIPGGESPYYDPRWIVPYQVVYMAVLVLFLVGLVHSLRDWQTFSLFYLLFGYLTAAYAVFNVITRYRWEIEPFLLIFGAIGVLGLMPASQRRS